ncbi:MAG TPA: AAA family ATPase [Opitutaceae bacterium]|nr:AAA family ATPase [Opitutaceae bacterium]
MEFPLDFPDVKGSQSITLIPGEALFVLGPNGSGKSRLLHRWFAAHAHQAERISAHRYGLFEERGIDLTSASRASTGEQTKKYDVARASLWHDHWPTQRMAVALFDLVASENQRSRTVAEAVDNDDNTQVETAKATKSPLKTLNRLLRISNLRFTVSIVSNDNIVAISEKGIAYPLAQLSDGERNAIFITAKVLTAKDGTLLLIDEPERHLHRSIISPLLTALFAEKSQCAFVISTHEVMLPIDNADKKVLLVRSCETNTDGEVITWDTDFVTSTIPDEDLLRKILGSRRKVLFTEGDDKKSIDVPLYSILFPDVSVIAKGSCRGVENAVIGIRSASQVHWVSAFGIIDSDGRSPADITLFEEKKIYAVPAYSIESIYYHPDVQAIVAKAKEKSLGGSAVAMLEKAKQDTLKELQRHKVRMCERVAEKVIRDQILNNLPGQPEIVSRKAVSINVDIEQHVQAEIQKYDTLMKLGDVGLLIVRYPVRETGVLNVIASALEFTSTQKYQSAVITVLGDDKGALDRVRTMFGRLYTDLMS